MSSTALNGHASGAKSRIGTKEASLKEASLKKEENFVGDEITDHNRWRLQDIRGCQTWHYLADDEQLKAWPQTIADRYHLGLDLDLPTLPKAHTPRQAVHNALTFFSKLQLEPGNWACEYGGPMFLLPGIVVSWYASETPIPEPYRIEIKRYLFARQNPEDGGWGLHIEGESTVFGTVMTYVVLRICGASAEDPRMVKGRGKLHELGGAVKGPHWAKFWLSVLGIADWDIVNPMPPELWLLPDWTPISPWRWWIHMRQVFLPMSFVWSRKFSVPVNPLILELREELFTQPHSSVDFASHRNTIAPTDNYHPKSFLLHMLNFILVYIWIPVFRTKSIVKKAEAWAYRLVQYEDANTDFANLAPVNAPLNLLACYVHDGPDSYSVKRHRERLPEYMWVKDEGMLTNGTNGLQTWDTSFAIQAVVEAGLAEDPAWRPMLTRALEFLDDQQIRENCVDQEICYRHQRKGAWAFSTRTQGYTVTDCTSEALKSVILLQRMPGYPHVVSDERLRDGIDTLLSMQNRSGGFASYEPIRGSQYLEYLNAAEVFGRIMIEYDYPECTTAVLTALSLFSEYDPTYRAQDVAKVKAGAVRYIRDSQRPDGSWYGSWGICFTYAGMFALESLASVGENHGNSERVRRACQFFVGKQKPDGGWGESYRSCEIAEYVQHKESQVVNTCWALLGLMEAEYPGDDKVIEKGIKLVIERQKDKGEWAQEGIEGVFNKSCMISYPNYKYIFPIKALGMYAKKFGDQPLI
ncbi:Lanosterol synthase (Oxidosqualene--lanosterol cyclase) [Agyrium rufum]|nr:Lanosterol synthase (Oxidosqualene--lanosterol cyclase) [Agyrium rufum]